MAQNENPQFQPSSENAAGPVIREKVNEKLGTSTKEFEFKFSDTLLLSIYVLVTLISMSICVAGFSHFGESKDYSNVRSSIYPGITIILCLVIIGISLCNACVGSDFCFFCYKPIQMSFIIATFLGIMVASGFLFSLVTTIGKTNNRAFQESLVNYEKTLHQLEANYTETVKNLQSNFTRILYDFNFTYSRITRDFSANYTNSLKLFDLNYTATMSDFEQRYQIRQNTISECMRGCQYIRNTTSVLICCYICVS